jgi:hypothetical protein
VIPCAFAKATNSGRRIEASDKASIALLGAQREARDLRKVGVVFRQPRLARRGGEHDVWWAHHAVSLQESEEMAETLSRFREVTGTVPFEPGDIASQDSVVHCADGSAVSVQPSSKLLSGAQRALDMTRRIPFVVEEGGEVVQVWSQGTTAQSGNHRRPYKEMFEHGRLLFPEVDWKRRRIARLDHAQEGKQEPVNLAR